MKYSNINGKKGEKINRADKHSQGNTRPDRETTGKTKNKNIE